MHDVERATYVEAHRRAVGDATRRPTAKLSAHRVAAAARAGHVPAGGNVRL